MRKIALVRILEKRVEWTQNDELIEVGGGFDALDFKEAGESEIQELAKAVALKNQALGRGEAYALLVQADPEDGRLLLDELAAWAKKRQAAQAAEVAAIAAAQSKRKAKQEQARLAKLAKQLGLPLDEVERLSARAKKP